jgi:hypothetical protein
MPRRKGPRRLTPETVRGIFKSLEPAKKIAARHGVSVNLVYLIQARRIHKSTTESIRAPRRLRRRGRAASARSGTVRIDLDRLADRIVKRLIRRLKGRG